VARFRNQQGETLIEVLMAIVLIGAISSAYFFAESTHSRVSSLNKELVTADGVARSYAELAKATVRNGCTAGAPFSVSYIPPTNFIVSTPPAGQPNRQICPASAIQPQIIVLTVTTPSNVARTLSFEVRTP
jgi:prepilin-type N-terminal cleavage/methylation domain-containing protein